VQIIFWGGHSLAAISLGCCDWFSKESFSIVARDSSAFPSESPAKKVRQLIAPNVLNKASVVKDMESAGSVFSSWCGVCVV